MKTIKVLVETNNEWRKLKLGTILRVNDKAASITGTVANPSKPSVRFTAFEEPTIIKIENGIKNKPRCKTKFLKKGK